jgi:hypothetical protein
VTGRAEIDVVGLRPLGDDLDVVGARVAGRNAGTLVVDRGRGEAVARLLLSGPVVEAARELAAILTSEAPALERAAATPWARLMLGAADRLERAIAEVDELDLVNGPDMPIPEPSDPSPVRRVTVGLQPGRVVHETVNTLMFGNPEGTTGQSMFRAVAVAGVVLVARPSGPEPTSFAAFNGARDALPCWAALADYLETMAENIRDQHAVAAAALAEQKGPPR